jgi:HK97 family phage major capsid protein
MPYDSIISRTDADALIPTEVSSEILKALPEYSAVMRLAKRLPNMSRYQRSIPVMNALATAYFVNAGRAHDDTRKKQTTDVSWENITLYAEEIAAIVPISEAVLDDADYDIWAEVKPSVQEALGIAFDNAVLWGTNAPTVWPDDLLTVVTAAGHLIADTVGDDLYDAIMAENGLFAAIEADGFAHNGHLGHLSMKSRLRGLRDSNGVPIFVQTMQEASTYALDGSPIIFPKTGIASVNYPLVTGDWDKLVYAIRQDITFKIFDQGVIQDADTGAITLNLMQQDCVAMRVVMRCGWQLPNPINRINSNATTRCPFAMLYDANGSGSGSGS